MRGAGTKLVVVGLISVMAVLLLAGTASARTRGFTIFNLSSEEVRISDVMTTATPAGEPVFEAGSVKPRKGQVLQPGESLHVELENPFSYTRRAVINFTSPGTDYYVTLDNYFEPKCLAAGGNRQCTITDGESTLTFLDRPGSRNVLTSDDIQGQAKALKELCKQANECEFEPLGRDKLYTPGKVYGSTVTNCEEAEVESKIAAERTFAISNSVGLESETEFKVLGLFKEKVTAKWEIKITEEEKFSQEVAVKVKPEHVAWVSVSVPVNRYTGDWTLRLGNTEWLLKGVYFDDPDPSRSGSFIADQEKLSEKQLEAECSHHRPGDGLLSTSAALVNTLDRGGRKADLLRGGPESNRLYGHGGHDVIRGGGGHDAIFGGNGGDAIKGGPGEDVIYGGPGADRIDDVRGPTVVYTGANPGQRADRVDVADGRADDTVRCQTRSTVVFADPGDRVTGPCGRVIRAAPSSGSV